VTPLIINQAGTALQVQVPALATTARFRWSISATPILASAATRRDLPGMTVSFTPNAQGVAAINFADGGLEGLSNESWGIDNVVVSQGTTTVYSNNFESGNAGAAWSLNTVDTSTPACSPTSWPLSSGGDTLNLTGLTAGQTYTLKFDFYALDSLDGEITTYGPDESGSRSITSRPTSPTTARRCLCSSR